MIIYRHKLCYILLPPSHNNVLFEFYMDIKEMIDSVDYHGKIYVIINYS